MWRSTASGGMSIYTRIARQKLPHHVGHAEAHGRCQGRRWVKAMCSIKRSVLSLHLLALQQTSFNQIHSHACTLAPVRGHGHRPKTRDAADD